MKNERESRKIVDKVIGDVYRLAASQRPSSLDGTWKADVLRQIRTLPQPGGQPPLGWLFQQYLWRMAPVASVLILCMVVWLAQGGLSPDIDIAALTLDNPFTFSPIEALGR